MAKIVEPDVTKAQTFSRGIKAGAHTPGRRTCCGAPTEEVARPIGDVNDAGGGDRLLPADDEAFGQRVEAVVSQIEQLAETYASRQQGLESATLRALVVIERFAEAMRLAAAECTQLAGLLRNSQGREGDASLAQDEPDGVADVDEGLRRQTVFFPSLDECLPNVPQGDLPAGKIPQEW